MRDPRASSAAPLVLGALLLLATATLAIAVLPIATCPACHGSGEAPIFYDKGGGVGPPCVMCGAKCRVTPFKRWTWDGFYPP